MFDNVVRVYDKDMKFIAQFDDTTEGMSEEESKNLMSNTQVTCEQNGSSTFSFAMLANSEKWQSIKDPRNTYVLNDKYYTALNEQSYQYGGSNGVSVVNVSLVETWYLLAYKYVQAYNCGIYTYAKMTFKNYVTDGAVFEIKATDCSTPSESIATAKAWEQVQLWTPKNDKGDNLTYAILKSDEYKPENWENAPAGVFVSDFKVSGNTATITIKARAGTPRQQSYDYEKNGTYTIDKKPFPANLKNVYVNSTIVTKETVDMEDGQSVVTSYTTSNKETNFTYTANTGTFKLVYTPKSNEEINSVIAVYEYSNLGDIKNGAKATIAYGAEPVDEHTFVVLPKANTKYKLTIDGVSYEDSEVTDSRGVVMPRGSAGYALWAALKNTDWKLGICDVIAKDFDASIDYGVFNVESDQKDVLYIINYIQQLYGGILIWDSKTKTVHLRAENSDDYQAYEDGFNDYTGYQFRMGKNMSEAPQITYDNNIITKGYLLGYGGLNVKKVNDGKTYVENYSFTDKVYEDYLEQSLIYDTNDEGGQKQLLYWGEKEIARVCKPRMEVAISAIDIRTVEGYEHEVFDVNDVVRVYYKDDQTGEETFIQKRVISWNYNPFAMWNCTVTLGDKTQNMTDVFKLVYNAAITNAPASNASNKISTEEITFSTTSRSFEDYINEKIGNQFSSVADLIIEANDNYAYAELFARYQKTTDKLISDTYAGLKVYADEKMSQLEALVTGNYVLKTDFGTFQSETAAGFAAQQTINNASTAQFSQIKGQIIDLEGNIENAWESIAGVYTYVDDKVASVDIIAEINNAKSWIKIDTTTGVSLGSMGHAHIRLDAIDDVVDISSYGSIQIGNYTRFLGTVDFTQTTAIKGLKAVWG